MEPFFFLSTILNSLPLRFKLGVQQEKTYKKVQCHNSLIMHT